MKLLLTAFLLATAYGTPITIHSTGVDQNGQSLAPGSLDPYWTLASVTGPATGAAGPLTYVPANGWPVTVWASDSPAEWIAPQSNVAGIVDFDPNGVGVEYTYQTSFTLTGLNPTTAELSGQFAADNYLASYDLNGHVTAVNPLSNASCGSGPYAFQSLTPFSIDSGFVAGVNTLSFTVVNSNCFDVAGATNPTGLLVQVAGTAEPLDRLRFPGVPEPGTMTMLALGLGCLGLAGRKTTA